MIFYRNILLIFNILLQIFKDFPSRNLTQIKSRPTATNKKFLFIHKSKISFFYHIPMKNIWQKNSSEKNSPYSLHHLSYYSFSDIKCYSINLFKSHKSPSVNQHTHKHLFTGHVENESRLKLRISNFTDNCTTSDENVIF